MVQTFERDQSREREKEKRKREKERVRYCTDIDRDLSRE